MEATLEGAADVRVRDVEIALVLAREMKAAADRSVDASLRLEQLQEVFGADSLDSAERARIQTALQMAGLDPRPSLLEADPAQPIRFAVGGDAAAAPAEAPAAEAAVEQRQEFPTVGEFARTAFRRFRGRRERAPGESDVTTALEQAPEPMAPEPEPEPEPLMEDLLDEPPAEEPPADEIEQPAESPNGHVDVATNGHSHLDFEDIAAPPHETATPGDFGAAETLDELDEYELEREADPELEHVLYAEPEPAAYEPEPDEPGLDEPEYEPVAAPEPVAYAEPGPPPQEQAVTAPAAGIAEIATVLLPVAAIPVVIASFAGWTFGLPFVALAVVATGLLAGRRGGGLVSALRSSGAARSILYATAVITVVALGIAAVLSGAGGGSDKPAASKPAPAKPTTPARKPTARAKQQPPKKSHKRTAKKHKAAPSKPDEDTKGLILVPPSQSAPSGTATTPGGSSAAPTTPQQPATPAPQQGPGR